MPHILPVALALAIAGATQVAAACPKTTRVSPHPGSVLPTVDAVITIDRVDGRFDAVEERGPALRSPEDSVDLRVVEHEGGRVVMTATRPLIDGGRYVLVFTRTETGFGLNRPIAPLRGAAWVAREAAPRCQGSFLTLLALFVGLPFGAGYVGVSALLGYRRVRQRRALDRLI